MVVKILYKLYPKEGLTREAFVDRWLKIVKPFSTQSPGIKKWVSNVVVSSQGEDPGYIVSGEIWFDSLKELQATLTSPMAKKALAEAPNLTSKETNVIVEEYVIK